LGSGGGTGAALAAGADDCALTGIDTPRSSAIATMRRFASVWSIWVSQH
jgi:hypothetical protein